MLEYTKVRASQIIPVVFPNKRAATIAHVFFPITDVFIAALILQLADTFALVINPVAAVLGAIGTKVRALAVLLVQDPVTNVAITVQIKLFSVTVAFVSPPLALVNKRHVSQLNVNSLMLPLPRRASYRVTRTRYPCLVSCPCTTHRHICCR